VHPDNGQLEKLKCSQSNTNKGRRIQVMKAPQRSLKAWTKQKWRTKSGKPSTQGPKATGERYLPEKAIKALSDKEYAATTKAKRAGTKKGQQFVHSLKRLQRK
jgi:predicted flavoprotein YhiN